MAIKESTIHGNNNNNNNNNNSNSNNSYNNNVCLIFEGLKDPPLNVSATNHSTPYSIPIRWKPIADEEDKRKLVGYRVTYRPVMDGGVKAHGTPVSFSVRNVILQVELTGLEPFMRYEIHISALTRKGAGPSGITLRIKS